MFLFLATLEDNEENVADRLDTFLVGTIDNFDWNCWNPQHSGEEAIKISNEVLHDRRSFIAQRSKISDFSFCDTVTGHRRSTLFRTST